MRKGVVSARVADEKSSISRNKGCRAYMGTTLGGRGRRSENVGSREGVKRASQQNAPKQRDSMLRCDSKSASLAPNLL
jgi:hypothetical protein